MRIICKAFLLVAALAALSLSLRAETPATKPLGTTATIGEKAPDFTFKDIRYLPRSLADFGDKKAFVVVFSTLDCPIVQRYLPRLKEMDEAYRDRGVQFLSVNVGPSDDLREIAYQAVRIDAKFPFVKDFDGQVARALGAERAGTVIVLDGDRKARYRGRVDSQFRLSGDNAQAGREDLKLAIEDVLAGRDVVVAETPVDGCKISFPKVAQPAAVVTFAEQIAPLLQKHCQDCHRQGGESPFSLMTYQETVDHCEMIQEVVGEGRMPPWYGSKQHGQFTNYRGMNAEEKSLLAAWANGGCPPGDLSKAPPARTFAESKWKIGGGTPDFILKTPLQKLPASGVIDYRYVILPHRFAEDTWVQGVQILPSNPRAMHHCNMAFMRLGEKFSDQNFITGQVPGGDAMLLDNHVGFLIPAGAALVLQIHYITTGEETTDQISVGLSYAREVIHKNLKHTLISNHGFKIAAGDPHFKLSAIREFPRDITGYGMFTHMHVRGKDMTFRAIYPDGHQELLLAVPNYNFEWQQSYRWAEGQQKFPQGTKIECVAHYDNSPFNPFNPDPKKDVVEGQQTFHEMMYGFVFYTEDDENLNLQIDPKTGLVVQAAAAEQSASNR